MSTRTVTQCGLDSRVGALSPKQCQQEHPGKGRQLPLPSKWTFCTPDSVLFASVVTADDHVCVIGPKPICSRQRKVQVTLCISQYDFPKLQYLKISSIRITIYFEETETPTSQLMEEFFYKESCITETCKKRQAYADRGEKRSVYKEALSARSTLPFPGMQSFPPKRLPHELLHRNGSQNLASESRYCPSSCLPSFFSGQKCGCSVCHTEDIQGTSSGCVSLPRNIQLHFEYFLVLEDSTVTCFTTS